MILRKVLNKSRLELVRKVVHLELATAVPLDQAILHTFTRLKQRIKFLEKE